MLFLKLCLMIISCWSRDGCYFARFVVDKRAATPTAAAELADLVTVRSFDLSEESRETYGCHSYKTLI